jgi:hypothetical protein
MHLAQRVNDYITKRRPDKLCDACIARTLEIRHQQANRVTMALETTSDFMRQIDRCHDCNKDQKVIRRS